MDAERVQPDAPSEPSEPPRQPLELVLERLAGLEAKVDEFQQRSAHRESVIDRLHEENQELRSGVRRAILEPAVTDLIRLHDALAREADRLKAQGPDTGASTAMMESFAGDVELILDRCGVEPFGAGPGDPYRPGDHRPVGVVPTDDPDQDNTIAELVAVGFRERDSNKVRRPLHARFHQYREAADSVSPDQPAPAADAPDDVTPVTT